ncbi:hypothetical protein FQN55_006393 [Onygenales sp. PD_40]|nr:hypothetical protein FQN55_006393 [Onygenales sp. PD_40]
MMFTATKLQTATYLLGVCLFSISFLVFLNSSISFVVTDLINLPAGEGDAVGTLGFADELLALVACPLWGMLSDRIGVRYVCTAGYAIIALSLALFVQARNVYPELLLGRLLFSLGGSAVTTMVTAVLPAVTASKDYLDNSSGDAEHPRGIAESTSASSSTPQRGPSHTPRPSNSSELTITPMLYRTRLPSSTTVEEKPRKGSTSHVAGFVGMLTGSGAVVALLIFLPLPAWFERSGYSPAQSIKSSYYIVAVLAIVVSCGCFMGLRHLPDDQYTGWRSLFKSTRPPPSDGSEAPVNPTSPLFSWLPQSYLSQFSKSFLLGFQYSDIGLAYLGGFVARASTIGISLFIPLYVNQYYRHSGLCEVGDPPNNEIYISGSDLGEIKRSCPKAYIVASILTGVAQLIALCCAPIFGYLSAKSPRHNIPLLAAALTGIIGYLLLAFLPSPKMSGPDGSAAIFIPMALIGISQIGSIVCSLAGLSSQVLGLDPKDTTLTQNSNGHFQRRHSTEQAVADPSDAGIRTQNERSALLPKSTSSSTASMDNLVHLKGSVAGMYSLYGGAGILLLTKIGGLLSDKVSPKAPFFILAGFNGVLLVAGIAIGAWRSCFPVKKST